MTRSSAPDATVIARDPRRLRALCALRQSAERDISVTLTGCSMTPTILPGSRRRLRCGRGEPKDGDIIAFHRDAALIVHRLISISEPDHAAQRHYICQGDGNSARDAPIAADEIVEVVTAIAPPPMWERVRQRAWNFARWGCAALQRAAGKFR